jgi:hypothetical protein
MPDASHGFIPVDDDWPHMRCRVEPIRPMCSAHGVPAHQIAVGETDYPLGIVAFPSEPVGDDYHALLDIARAHCFSFMLVWRDQLTFSAKARELEARLEGWKCYERRTDRWPGTRILESLAWVRWYAFTDESLDLLKQANQLYGWMSPDYPEDLAFYLADGRGWLGTISHEREGWVDLTALDRTLVQSLLSKLIACQPSCGNDQAD